MHLLPPFVTTHHQNVAFFVFLLNIVLVQQSISGAPFDDPSQSSSDSSDGERRRPMQPRAGVSTQLWPSSIRRTMSSRTRSGPLLLGRPFEMNKPKWNSQPLLSSNNSRPPSLENTIKAFEEEKNMKKLDEKRIKIHELLCDDLKQIQKNIRRSKQPFFKRLLHFKVKSNEKKQAKNAELRDKFLDYIPEEDECEQLLPTWDPITGKTYKDYELRMEACRKLNALTGWVAVKAAISAMEKSAKLSQCSTIYEDDDDDDNSIDRLSNPKSSPRDKSKSKTEKLKQLFKFNKKKEKVNNYLPSPKGNAQRSISFRDNEYENRQMHKGLIEPRRSLDIASERIVSRTKSVDMSQTLQRNSIQRSTSTNSNNFGFDFGNDNGTLTRHSMQPSTSTNSNFDGTLTRHSMSGFSKSKMQKNFVEGRRSVDNHIELHSSYAEIGDESKNLPCVLQRSSSVRNTGMARSLSVGAELFDLKADEEDIFKEPIIYTVQWDVLQTGMLCMRDKNLKKNILAMCRRVNYELQLLILQNLLLKKSDSNEGSSLEEREQNLKIRENMIETKENFKNERTYLLSSLDRISKGQLGEEFNKALVELRDKVVAHWTWLYESSVIWHAKKDQKTFSF